MESILVLSVPKEAFNKHRRISDLVRKQVEHFKHIEEKLPTDVRENLPQHAIITEDDAARYIAAMTTYLLSRPQPKEAAKKAVAIKPPAPTRPSPPLVLAAVAAPPGKKSIVKKKFVPKKETPAVQKSRSIKPEAKKASPKRKK